MKEELVRLTNQRIVDELEGDPLYFIYSLDTSKIIDIAVERIFMYTKDRKRISENRHAMFTEVAISIGNRLRINMPRDTPLSVRAGAFILYSFEALGITKVERGQGSSEHATYLVKVIREDILNRLWNSIEVNRTEKLPSLTEPPAWMSSKNINGIPLVKTRSWDTLDQIKPELQPITFNAVNKLQKVPWQINGQVYEAATWALRNKADAFNDIWSMQNEEAKQSKLRETHTIANLAKRFLGKTFYHLHTLDFRGRIYTSTAYLSHQGTDFSKGLLVRADSKEIGEQGVYWLLVSIATHWGGDAGRADGAKTDKIPLNDRVKWVLANETEILSYAIDFKKNKGWFNADKPWQFLAGCFELKKLREWQVFMKATRGANYNPYAFKSSYTAWLDGSNNGVQHICAITRDEITAPHANLVPLSLPGDLYSYVAEHVWAKIETRVANMSDRERMAAEEIIDELISMKIQVFESLKKGEDKQILAEMLFGFKSKNMAALKKAAPVFWNRITDKKQRRKIAKRNTMTLSYGATPYGMGTQIQDDSRKHGIELLRYSEQVFSTYLGRLIFEDCKESMSKPMRLLEVFEHAGEMAEARKEYLSWHVPITNFPVKQYYTEGKVKKVWVQYGPPKGERLNTERFENTFQLNVAFAEDPGPSPRKQKSGAAPNIVHSLDAAHLQMVVDAAPFGMSVVHDSFGALLADLPELFVLTREKFVELHKSQPLISIMKEIQGDINNVQYGSLDIELVLQSEYAFS